MGTLSRVCECHGLKPEAASLSQCSRFPGVSGCRHRLGREHLYTSLKPPLDQEVAYPESLLETNLRVPLGLCCLESRTMLFLAAFCACASPHVKPMGVQEALALE